MSLNAQDSMYGNSFDLNFGSELDTINFFNISTNCIGSSDVVFYNFTTFVTALAVLILAWTNTDYKYRFRFNTAFFGPTSLFVAVVVIGIVTVLNDGLILLPKYSSIVKQMILAFSLLFVISYWVVSCFRFSSKFNRFNHERYRKSFQKMIVLGRNKEIASIVEDFALAVPGIVEMAENRYEGDVKSMPEKTKNALRVIELMGNEKFAKIVVSDCVDVAKNFFDKVIKTGKYKIGMDAFAENFITQALLNEESFLFNESKLSNGVLANVKPVVSSIYSDYALIDHVPWMIEPHYTLTREWNASQVKAYSVVLLEAVKAYFRTFGSVRAFDRALENLVSSARKLDKVEDVEKIDDKKEYLVYKQVLWFFRDLNEILAKIDVPKGTPKESSCGFGYANGDFFDVFAKAIAEIIEWSFMTRGRNAFYLKYSCCWDAFFHAGSVAKCSEILRYRVICVLKNDINHNWNNIRVVLEMLYIFGLNVKASSKNYFVHEHEFHTWLLKYTSEILLLIYNDPNQKPIVDNIMPQGMRIDVQNKKLELNKGLVKQSLDLI